MTIDAKNFILIVVALIIMTVVGLYIPYKQYQKERQDIKSAPETINERPVVTVLYTNKGFGPNMITVKIGSTVEWISVSDKLMWVASDPHPSHTNLPGFDQQGVGSSDTTQGLLLSVYAHTGQTEYRYTFLKAGNWSYHNHLNPADRGTVIAE